MVDVNDLARVNEISYELTNVAAGIANLTDGGKVIGVIIAPPPAPEPPYEEGYVPRLAANVNTTDVDFPPEMTDALLVALQAQHDALIEELRALGVTNDSGL